MSTANVPDFRGECCCGHVEITWNKAETWACPMCAASTALASARLDLAHAEEDSADELNARQSAERRLADLLEACDSAVRDMRPAVAVIEHAIAKARA